jgi:putative ABC transport system substrate-binding protein
MKRREFIVLLGGAVAAWPVAARAQQIGKAAKISRVGVLWHAGSAEEERDYLPVLRQAFSDLGYVEGRTIAFEHRFPAERAELFRDFARDLVERGVDAIVAVTEPGAIEARRATDTIPVVVVLSPDPIAARLVDSLAHLGGNVTGLSLMSVDLSGKRLALFKEAVPGLSRVAVLVDPGNPAAHRFILANQAAGEPLGLMLRPIDAPTPEAIDQAFAVAVRDGADGMVIGTGSMLFNERARIGSNALAHKLPVQVYIGEMVQYGPLMSYGQDFPDYFRRAAGYVDKILKGAKPADLPVEQPTRFKLVINLKTAKALGLTVPLSLLVQADEVIE